jgi:hypothetical protein
MLPARGFGWLAKTRTAVCAVGSETIFQRRGPARQVRLEHMLQRLRSLQGAAATGCPTRLMPNLYLSGAVEANSHHVLRHLRITHVLNATEVLCRGSVCAGEAAFAIALFAVFLFWFPSPSMPWVCNAAGGLRRAVEGPWRRGVLTVIGGKADGRTWMESMMAAL